MNLKGLTPQSLKVFEAIKTSDLLQEYILIGGTALSLQINNRLSEDLDFCKWQNNPGISYKEVNWPELEKFLKTIGNVRTDIIDLYQVNFFLDEVKITFYSNAITTFNEIETGYKFDNLTLASVNSIGAMKLEVMSRRNLFRDYYDVYSILKEGISLKEIVSKSSRFSFYRMKTKAVLGIISNGSLFRKEEKFSLLEPRYNVTSQDIQSFIREKVFREYGLVRD
jgi:predicted nucleotidyltransferase component of viral defense system